MKSPNQNELFMATVRYKEISKSLENLTKPSDDVSRISIGLEKNIGEYYYIHVNDLLPYKNQARQHFAQEEIELLANSIKEHGIRHPLTIIACDNEKGKFQVVSGERRLRAAKLIGLDKVPCILLKDKTVADEIAIIENMHRQNLHPVELGNAFDLLLKSGVFKNQIDLARKLSITKSTVSEHLQFADLDGDTKKYLITHNITSRAKLRKIINAKDNKSELQKILGLSHIKQKAFSILSISAHDDSLKVQIRALKRLDSKLKSQFKAELQKIINTL